ncbi:MAG: DNA-directed RNA polymerase subunit beta' [Candidatus Marinimicrobia bacterium]|nr:DNA-directed RNA polymerase subunit beta' [Candidatus Neomarinimicrobiota bacterium]
MYNKYKDNKIKKSGSISKIYAHLSSPETILRRSRGEVTKPETINYRSYKPEKDGLFCERIFGPVKDYECHCGKYKRIRYKGIICDRCGVEVTRKKVRRERTGHIALAVPCVHIWFLKSIPSKLYYLLGIKTKPLEEIIYYEKYVVINPGKSDLSYKSVISEEEYLEHMEKYGKPTGSELFEEDEEEEGDYFIAKTGGEAILELLKNLDVVSLYKELKRKLDKTTAKTRKRNYLKRLKVIRAFLPEDDKPENKPEWMVVTILPVIPPDLRPLVPLEGGRFAASDLNDLYRRVIIRNNRLKQLMDINAPDVILRNEKRMLQEAVDSLIDNSKRRTEVRSGTRRPLKSLSDMVKGKEGRFRQNLLGKRVDYSGRSVIVVGPKLKLHQCGLPKKMAIELFKPHIIHQLVRRGIAQTSNAAKNMVERRDKEVYRLLDYVVKDHPVMLNRAPTLHKLGIQAFEPVLVDGNAIRLHPLVCPAFNADFDGDQMAVHVPLSQEAIVETRTLMLSSHNILHPAHGNPIALPTQDMVLGIYYLTRKKDGVKGEGKVFASLNEVHKAYAVDKIELHAKIKVRVEDEVVETTAGRAIFNSFLPDDFEYVNQLVTKRDLEGIVGRVHKEKGNETTVQVLDDLKEQGFGYAEKSGITMSMSDVIVPEEKKDILQEAFDRVEDIQEKNRKGVITEGERYNKIIDEWTHTTNRLSRVMAENFKKVNQGFNPLNMMVDSGARGSTDQIKQLAAMRGLMAKPQKSLSGSVGEIIETPITSNFKEGLTVLEYFISTHGARKGLADTALKTADAGYLTRRLVDVSQDVVVNEEDCGTIAGIEAEAIKEEEKVIESIAERIEGRVAQQDVYHPDEEDELIVEVGQMITEEKAREIEKAGIENVRIRSVLTCESRHGVCAKCYGKNLSTNKMVTIGVAVGITAAQAIGEPGTQLTLRTFHLGGTAARVVEESETKAKTAGKVRFTKDFKAVDRKDQEYKVVLSRNSELSIVDDNNRATSNYNIPYGAHILVDENDEVEVDDILFRWDIYSDSILAMHSGEVRFEDMIEDITYRIEADESGHKSAKVIEAKDRKIAPRIDIVSKENGEEVVHRGRLLPVEAMIKVSEGDKVKKGDVLAKKPKETGKTSDITGGLPRVAELFEARKPKNPAIITEINGVVKYGKTKRGRRRIIIEGEEGQKKKYKMPYGRYVLVHEGDRVTAGDRLCEGPVSPRDILKVKDPRAVQDYLLNQIQEVYRLQGVRINDKHIEVVIRQMMKKVVIQDPGDTDLLEKDVISKNALAEANEKIQNKVVVVEVGDSDWEVGDIVDRTEFTRYNRQLKEEDKAPAKARVTRPARFSEKLNGITRASLGTESFLSAASFQETTRVLTDASTAAKRDDLIGLKENVIIGQLIPAGTGQRKYENLVVLEPEDETEEWAEVQEKKNKEKQELEEIKK